MEEVLCSEVPKKLVGVAPCLPVLNKSDVATATRAAEDLRNRAVKEVNEINNLTTGTFRRHNNKLTPGQPLTWDMNKGV